MGRTERNTVVTVGETRPGLADAFDLSTVDGAEDAAHLSYAGQAESGDGVDCLLCPAETVGELVRELADNDVSVPVVAIVRGDADSALTAGATEVVDAGAPDTVVVERIRNVVARSRLPGIEAALDAERALLSDIFERVPIHLYVKDAEGRHIRVSNAYLETPESFVGNRDVDLGDSPHTRQGYADDMHVIETGEPIIDKEEDLTDVESAGWSIEQYLEQYESVNPPEVAEEWVLTSKVPRYDADGDVVGLIGVTRDISERKTYQHRLEAQNERLDEFASIVSHDLRTPLSVARGYLELAADDCETEAGLLGRVEESLDRMDAIIDDVLRLAREEESLDTGATVDLAAVVRRAWALVDGDATRATLDLGRLPAIRADETRLQRLVENLLRNCLEHGGSDVTVRVDWIGREPSGPADRCGAGDEVGREGETRDCTRTGEGFAVDDDGPGIDATDPECVFERGYTTSETGTGLGLGIVTDLADTHGWTVTVGPSARGGARVEVRGVTIAEEGETADDDDRAASDENGAGQPFVGEASRSPDDTAS